MVNTNERKWKHYQFTSAVIDMESKHVKSIMETLNPLLEKMSAEDIILIMYNMQPIFERIFTDNEFPRDERILSPYGETWLSQELNSLIKYKENFKEAFDKW